MNNWERYTTAGGALEKNTVLGNVLFPFGRYNNPEVPYATAAPKQASDIGLDPKLMQAFQSIGAQQQGNIAGVYGGIRNQFGADAGSHGAQPGGYVDQRLNTGQGLSNQGLESSLGGVLGDEGYNSYKSQRDFNQNMTLAQYTGELNKPTTLQQVLGGIGGAAQIGAAAYGSKKNSSSKKSKSLFGDEYNQYSGDNEPAYTSDDSYNA